MNTPGFELTVSLNHRRVRFSLDVDLAIERETFVLFGPSGAGKTSILHAIAGLFQPAAGTIQFGEETWFHRPPEGRTLRNVPTPQRGIGMVFQDRALFPHLTVLENVNYGVDDESRARYWLTECRLPNYDERYPDELSGGQQQRVALARTLAHEPRLLLLDEPYASLDYQLSRELQEVISQYQQEQDIPVVYVTHDRINAIELGQRLAIINDGNLIEVVNRRRLEQGTVSSEVRDVFGPVPHMD